MRVSSLALVVSLLGALSTADVFAVPSDKEAWRSDEHGILIYRDAVEEDAYWFIPKIRFEASSELKTLLRTKKLENGSTEYTVRIIPYFSKDLKELAAENISNIRQDSQLKPVTATSIGISLPDFGYKFASANVTNFQYLDSPRLLRFTLPAADAETFDLLYADEYGVNVDFTLTYEGMMTDKFYNIQVSCKNMADELAISASPSVDGSIPAYGTNVVLGAEIEAAFVNSVTNSSRNVDIISKGDLAGMQEMIRRVVNLCFESVAPDYDSRRRSTSEDDIGGLPPRRVGQILPPRSGNVIDPGYIPRSNFFEKSVDDEIFQMKALHDSVLIEKNFGPGDDLGTPTDSRQTSGGLLPEVQARAKFRIKHTMMNDDKQAVVKQVSLKDTTSVFVIPGYLSANAKKVETVQVKTIAEKSFRARVVNSMAAPLRTGIQVKAGEQWTINSAFVFNSRSTYSSSPKQYAWDATWPKTDKDLYFRVGSGHWTPVNGRSIIESGVIGGGELQFYVDRGAIYNKLPEKFKKLGCLGLCGPIFKVGDIEPEFTIQVSGRRIEVK